MNSTDAAIRLHILSERRKSALSRAFLRIPKEIEISVESILRGMELNELPLPRVSRILTIEDQNLQNRSQILMTGYLQQLRNFAEAQAQAEARAWGAGTEPSVATRAFEVPLGIDSPDRGKILDAFVLRWWNTAREHAFGTIRRYAFEGKSNREILTDIKGQRRLRYADGLMDTLRRHAIGISNTAIQHLITSVRMAVLQNSAAKGVLWSAILEGNTCARCRGLDNVPFSVDKGPRAPLHMNCRCIMVPVFDKSSMPRESYYEWLKRQDEDFITSVLGIARGRVFIDGGMSAKRFAELQLDKKFEPITLEEFRKLAPRAFSKAGV